MDQIKQSFLTLRHVFSIFLFVLFLVGANVAFAQENAATAVSVRGLVTATDTSGDIRRLKRGDPIFSGETIETGNRARIRMSFTDGATAVLKAGTTYEISDYSFSGQEDGTERASFRLVSGALEMLSGLIGKQNQNAFRLDTPLATIGLRGTEFVVAVYPPATPGGQPTVRVSVVGGAVVYSSPGAPPIQLPQGNSVEQLGGQPPTSSNTITEPFVTITVEGDDVEEALETLFETEVTTDEEAEDAQNRNNEASNEGTERNEQSSEDGSDGESSSSVEGELADEVVEDLRQRGDLTDEQIRELQRELRRINDQTTCPTGQVVSPAGSGRCVPL